MVSPRAVRSSFGASFYSVRGLPLATPGAAARPGHGAASRGPRSQPEAVPEPLRVGRSPALGRPPEGVEATRRQARPRAAELPRHRRRGRMAVLRPLLPLLASLGLVMAAGIACVWREARIPQADAVTSAPVSPPGVPQAPGATRGLRQPAAPAAPYVDAALQTLVERAVDRTNGDTAVVVRHLRTGATASYHERDVYPAASLAKLPVLVEAFWRLEAGTLRPEDLALITADTITDGAGVLQGREGDQLPIAELLRLAVTVSDNVAMRVLLKRLGGVEAVNRSMAGMGLSQTRLYADGRPNTTSAADMAALLARLATRPDEAPGSAHPSGPAAPLPNTLSWLLALPQAQAWLASGVPGGVAVAHKSGQLPNVRHDAGIVYAARGPYVIVGLTDHLANQDAAEAFLTRLSQSVYGYFNG